MDTKLTLYDILAIIVPGGIAVLLINSVLLSLGYSFPVSLDGNLTGTTTFLIVTYFVGHVIQAIGKLYESRILEKRWGGLPSVRFLRENDGHFSSQFKTKLLELVENQFGFTVNHNDSDEMTLDLQRKEIFNLCYSYVFDNELGRLAYLMNASYGLFRGLVVSCLICTLILIIAACLHYTDQNVLSASICFSIGAILFIVSLLFDNRVKQRGEQFADNIYRSYISAVIHTKGGLE